jgi:predicted acetyltransferase
VVSTDFRAPAENEERAIRELAVLSFNVPPGWVKADAGPSFHPEDYLCAYEDGRLLATTRGIPMQQWFGGRPVPASGVASVATTPEVRGTGIGDALMRALLERSRESGAFVTSLFPATVPFYRRLGYEFGGTWTVYEAPLATAPRSTGDTTVELFEGDDVSGLQASYRTWASGRTGPVEGATDDWWTDHVLMRWFRDSVRRAVVARGSAGVEGYATFSLQSLGRWKGFDVECTHLVATTAGALSALLGYFRRYKGVGEGLRWRGSPNDPGALLFYEETLRVQEQFRYMTRVLDVAGALEARGYPESVSGQVVLDVDDPQFAENRGAFRLTVQDGTGKVERTEADPDSVQLSIRALSALFAGYASTTDLATGGLLDRPNTLLSELFAGPPAFMLDHF